jgi:hypothetical protein
LRYLPVLFALLLAGCSTTEFTKEQAQSNEQIFATAFMESVWTIDPATYFDDEKLAAHELTWRPKRLGPGEYVHIREEVVEGYGLNTYEEDKRAGLPARRSWPFSRKWGRVFQIPVPIATAGAMDVNRAGSRFPMDAMVLLHVWRAQGVQRPVDDQPFTDWMEILTVKAVRTIDDQRYLASRMSRDDQAAPMSARRLAELLGQRGVPLSFEVSIEKKVIGKTTYHGGDHLRYLFEDVTLTAGSIGDDAGLTIEDPVAKDSNFEVDLEAPPRLHSVGLGMTSGVGSPADRCQALFERGEHREGAVNVSG